MNKKSKTENPQIDSVNSTSSNALQSILSCLSSQTLRECFVGTAVIIGLIGTFTLAIFDQEAKSQFINITHVLTGTYIGLLIPRDRKK